MGVDEILANEVVVSPVSKQQKTTFTYLPGTNRVETQITNGDKTEYGYDYRHRRVSTTIHPSSGKTLTTSSQYENNLLFSTTDAYGRSSYYNYRVGDSALIRQVQGTVPSYTLVDYAAVVAVNRDSSANADIVVKEPANPNAISRAYFPSRFHCCDATTKIPKIKEPITFTINTFIGSVPKTRGDSTILYRRMVPITPPIASNPISIPFKNR